MWIAGRAGSSRDRHASAGSGSPVRERELLRQPAVALGHSTARGVAGQLRADHNGWVNRMKKSHLLFTLPFALAVSAGALADDRDDRVDSKSGSTPAVEQLKSKLPSTHGFEVDNVRTTGDGVSCINYRVANDTGGETRAQAVVKGDDVFRSTTRSTHFEKAWNKHCAGAG